MNKAIQYVILYIYYYQYYMSNYPEEDLTFIIKSVPVILKELSSIRNRLFHSTHNIIKNKMVKICSNYVSTEKVIEYLHYVKYSYSKAEKRLQEILPFYDIFTSNYEYVRKFPERWISRYKDVRNIESIITSLLPIDIGSNNELLYEIRPYYHIFLQYYNAFIKNPKMWLKRVQMTMDEEIKGFALYNQFCRNPSLGNKYTIFEFNRYLDQFEINSNTNDECNSMRHFLDMPILHNEFGTVNPKLFYF